jgi:glycosyltransferase involved in cell wall biosynthesis
MTAEIAFVDTLAPRAYGLRPESLAGLGGTEMTLARVAGCLASGATVEIRQTARWTAARDGLVNLVPFDRMAPARVFVVVNSWKVAILLRRQHAGARILLWLHVFPGRHNRGMGAALAAAGVEVVCVSASHARWMRAFLPHPQPRIGHIPNPVDDELMPDGTARDPDLLLFASAPHKGLDQVYAAFAAARRAIPTLRLAVADPGYLRWPAGAAPEGVEPLGRLAQAELHGWMRRALCLFYPQTRFAETFGLVIAEANALGCPALVHRGLGANDEVASTPGQCLDAMRPDLILGRLQEWRACPPAITGRDEHRATNIGRLWRDRIAAIRSRSPVACLEPV